MRIALLRLKKKCQLRKFHNILVQKNVHSLERNDESVDGNYYWHTRRYIKRCFICGE